MRKLLLIIVTLLIAGCDNSPQPERIESQISVDSGRFKVVQVAKFSDSDAYNDVRKIFLITDKQTGVEYVGVSGVGISETGSHSQVSGKVITTHKDER